MASTGTPRPSPPTSPWSPLRHRTFGVLWSATVVSNIGSWMGSVGAGWLMASLTSSAGLVAFVQVAAALPVFLLALPAGSLADIVGRRRVLLICQIGMCMVSAVLAWSVGELWITAILLLLLTFLLSAWKATAAPAWQAALPTLVPRGELQPAIALNGIGINISRAIGPALAGLCIAAIGMASPFAIDAISSLAVIGALIWWRPAQPAPSTLPPERLWNGMRVGLRYARSNRPLTTTLLRAFVYLFFVSAFWALLPLIAKRSLHGGATLYGLMLACVGLGAVAGGFLLPWFRGKLGVNGVVACSTVATSCMIAVFAMADSKTAALIAGVILGVGWLCALVSFSVSAQTALPDWVRARGMSIYIMVISGGMTLGSIVWGQVADVTSIRVSLLIAGAGALVSIPLVWRAKLGLGDALDLTPSLDWPAPVTSGEIGHERGPTMTTVEYRIDPADARDFVTAMDALGRVRRRSGALAWDFFEDTAEPGRYLECFIDPSWSEHLRHHERITVADRFVQDRVNAFHRGSEPPRVTHYLAPDRYKGIPTAKR